MNVEQVAYESEPHCQSVLLATFSGAYVDTVPQWASILTSQNNEVLRQQREMANYLRDLQRVQFEQTRQLGYLQGSVGKMIDRMTVFSGKAEERRPSNTARRSASR